MRKALKVWYAGFSRDYALMPNGDVLSVNAVGLEVIDIRWAVVSNGKFVGDKRDAECLAKVGYTNIESYKPITRPTKAR